MPDSPVRAKFLKEDDKLVAIERCVFWGYLLYLWLYTNTMQTPNESAGRRKQSMEMEPC